MLMVGDLFEIAYGHSLELNRLKKVVAPRGVAFVSRTSKHNGVSARVEAIPGVEPAPAGALSVALGTRNYTLQTCLQVEPFYCGRDVVYLVPKRGMGEAEKIWWALCIQANRFRFNFGRQANRTVALLTLPDGIPSWVSDYHVPEILDVRVSADRQCVSLPEESWSRYELLELFELRHGRSVPRREMKPGTTPLVSAIMSNNGVSGLIDQVREHPSGCISVASNGNGMGWAFYQPAPFVASVDMTVLRPLRVINEACALFVCAVIMSDRWRWSYGRKWTIRRLAKSSISLPSKADGKPDWTAIDCFMRSLPFADLAF